MPITALVVARANNKFIKEPQSPPAQLSFDVDQARQDQPGTAGKDAEKPAESGSKGTFQFDTQLLTALLNAQQGLYSVPQSGSDDPKG